MRRAPVAIMTGVLAGALILLPAAGSGAVAATDDDPLFVEWSSLLPAVPGDSAPSPTVDDSLTGACSQGLPACVTATTAIMQRQFNSFDTM